MEDFPSRTVEQQILLSAIEAVVPCGHLCYTVGRKDLISYRNVDNVY